MAFNIIGTVKSVLLHSKPYTFYEVVILDVGEKDYSGDSFADVETISIRGPNGLLNYSKEEFDFSPNVADQYFLSVTGTPAVGTYNFSVKIGGVREHYETTQEDILKIPLPPMDSLVPHKNDIYPSGMVKFSWYRVKGAWYYAIDIRDADKKSVVGAFTYCKLNTNNIHYELTPGEYEWRLVIMDGVEWRTINNRAHTKWVKFTVI